MDEDGNLTGVLMSVIMRKIRNLDDGFRIKIDHEDDLWTLSQICTPGSIVGMLSHRRDSTTGTQENSRRKVLERKPMWIVLEVQSSSFIHSQKIYVFMYNFRSKN